MATKTIIRTLVVDDSSVFRELIIRGFKDIPEIEVVAAATDAFDAAEKIPEIKPDVMICDIQMPKLNGIEFIKQLMPQYEIPTIVVSTISNAIFDALDAGAVDFVTKPDIGSVSAVSDFLEQLASKVRIAAASKTIIFSGKRREASDFKSGNSNQIDVIAIGASTGGIEATYQVLQRLSPNVPGIVVVQHIPPVFSTMYAEKIDTQTDFFCKEAENGDIVKSGTVLIAPGQKHLYLKKKGSHYEVEVRSGEKVNGHCPSVDVLFESVASSAGKHAIGIILTGMGYDGAKGLLKMRRVGAKTIAEDEQSCVVYGMPKAAVNIGAVDEEVPLNRISDSVHRMLSY